MKEFIKKYPLLTIAFAGELIVALTCNTITSGFQVIGFSLVIDAFVLGLGMWINGAID